MKLPVILKCSNENYLHITADRTPICFPTQLDLVGGGDRF